MAFTATENTTGHTYHNCDWQTYAHRPRVTAPRIMPTTAPESETHNNSVGR